MAYKWDSKLEIGDKTIDDQHKELVVMYNKLLAICASEMANLTEKNAEIEKALNFLCTYTVKHFTDEELLQKNCGFPGYEEHRAQHEEFKMKAYTLSEKFKEIGFSDKFATILNTQVGLWLITHIQDEDSKIAAYIK